MDTYLFKFLEDLFRRHGVILWVAALLIAVVACWVMIGAGGAQLVYEGF